MNYKLQTTATFDKWYSKLKDKSVKYRLEARFSRLTLGNFGDAKSVGNNVFELRFFFGSGYRVYYTMREGEIVLLLCAGDKATQNNDIELSYRLCADLNKTS